MAGVDEKGASWPIFRGRGLVVSFREGIHKTFQITGETTTYQLISWSSSIIKFCSIHVFADCLSLCLCCCFGSFVCMLAYLLANFTKKGVQYVEGSPKKNEKPFFCKTEEYILHYLQGTCTMAPETMKIDGWKMILSF